MSDTQLKSFALGVSSDGSIAFSNEGTIASVCNDSLIKFYNVKEQSIESFDIEQGV